MWPDLQETADSVTFTEEIINGKLHFLCSRCFFLEIFTFEYSQCILEVRKVWHHHDNYLYGKVYFRQCPLIKIIQNKKVWQFVEKFMWPILKTFLNILENRKLGTSLLLKENVAITHVLIKTFYVKLVPR